MPDTDPEMTPVDPPPPRRTAFEWSLAALRPADGGVGRPSFMFQAGQASRERAVRAWRGVAAGLTVALAGTAAVAVGLVTEARQRAEAAEARARPPQPLSPWGGAGGDGASSGTGSGSGSASESESASDSEKVANEAGRVKSPGEDPTPQPPPRSGEGEKTASPRDVAAALRLRRDILTAGLGLIPDARPAIPDTPSPSGEWDRHWGLPSGVLTTPKIEPRKPAPIIPDDDPPAPDK